MQNNKIRILQTVCFVLVIFYFQQSKTFAEKTNIMLGSKVVPQAETYITKSSVNIRKIPSIKGKKIGHFKKGTRIQSLGITNDGYWIVAAVKEKPIGFVFLKVLQLVVDGDLKNDLVGNITLQNNRRCGYTIQFIGKSEVEGQNSFMTDYDVSLSCIKGKIAIIVPAQMFLAEVPFKSVKSGLVFQINLDILDSYHAMDDVFSTIIFFHPRKNEVKFGGTSHLNYDKGGTGKKSLPANSLEEALESSLKLAIGTWNSQAWSDFVKYSKK